ncbi:C-type lectin mosGCTL-1-like [Glandiceps talaboti]
MVQLVGCLFVLALCSPAFGQNIAPICSGYTYHLYTDPLTWADANEACKNQEGELVQIRDRQLHNAVAEYLRQEMGGTRIKSVWLGLNDIAEEGKYVWTDGTELIEGDYDNWAPGEPNDNNKKNTNGQDCGQLWRLKDWQWDDGYCDNKRAYVCQYSMCQ